MRACLVAFHRQNVFVGVTDCRACGSALDGDAAAIGAYGDPEQFTYIAFVEDLRSSGFRLIHPACFAKEHGVDILLDVIHERDRIERAAFWKTVRETEDQQGGRRQ